MNLQAARPPSEFADLVDTLVDYTDYRPEHRIERVFPDGHSYLVVELDGMARRIYENESLAERQTVRGAWFSGPQTRYISIEACHDSSMFVVRFRPGGALPFADVSLDGLSDTIVDAANVFGHDILRLRESLLSSASADVRFGTAGAWLKARHAEGRPRVPAIADAVSGIVRDPTFVLTSLTAIVDRSGYSHKHFLKLFKDHVGLTPKVLQRILRFSEILPLVVGRHEISWTDISFRCGYADQSHFIREFRQFSGYNPSEFLRGAPDSRTNFIPAG